MTPREVLEAVSQAIAEARDLRRTARRTEFTDYLAAAAIVAFETALVQGYVVEVGDVVIARLPDAGREKWPRC